MSINYRQLSKTLSLALRHRPELFNLELDCDGWVEIDALLDALQKHKRKWQTVDLIDIQKMMAHASKQRFELQDGRIRALYGHSGKNSVQKLPSQPPVYLWHGAPESAVPAIKQHGLKPMRRQFVHMAVEQQMAREVAYRKGEIVMLLKISALDAYHTGHQFYLGNDNVWLADFVPTEFIEVFET